MKKGALIYVLWADSTDVNDGLSSTAEAGTTNQSLLELLLVDAQPNGQIITNYIKARIQRLS